MPKVSPVILIIHTIDITYIYENVPNVISYRDANGAKCQVTKFSFISARHLCSYPTHMCCPRYSVTARYLKVSSFVGSNKYLELMNLKLIATLTTSHTRHFQLPQLICSWRNQKPILVFLSQSSCCKRRW